MVHNYKNFLALMAKNRNLLVFDDGILLKEYKEVLETFGSYFYNNANEDTIHSLQSTLIRTKVDLVLIYTKNSETILDICNKVANFDKTIVITAIVTSGYDNITHQIVKCADSILYPPFDSEDLYKQLSIALSAKLMMYEMSHTLNTHKKFLDDTGIELYLDTYEDDAKVLIEVLQGYAQRLQAGELNQELFSELAQELENIGQIFTYHHYTAHLRTIFDEMVAFLRTYDFDEIDLEILEGFDYLVAIVEDIQTYLNNFFIQRIFSDVYVFEHSLHDTIVFMMNHLTKEKENRSELEFF